MAFAICSLLPLLIWEPVQVLFPLFDTLCVTFMPAPKHHWDIWLSGLKVSVVFTRYCSSSILVLCIFRSSFFILILFHAYNDLSLLWVIFHLFCNGL